MSRNVDSVDSVVRRRYTRHLHCDDVTSGWNQLDATSELDVPNDDISGDTTKHDDRILFRHKLDLDVVVADVPVEGPLEYDVVSGFELHLTGSGHCSH